jgi:hypothetical protein
MEIKRSGSQPSQKAPAEHFTGVVRLDPLFQAIPPGRVTVGPNEKHWHGASPTTAMTHIAIAEALDGSVVEWLEKVTDDQYRVQ